MPADSLLHLDLVLDPSVIINGRDPNIPDEDEGGSDEERCGESVPKRFLGSRFHPLTRPHSDSMMKECYFYWLKYKLPSFVNIVSKNDEKIMINKKVMIF